MPDALAGLLTVLALAGLATLLVLGAVRRTARRHQAGLPPPPDCPPPRQPLLGPVPARYLGTTYAPSTLRRFAGHGLLGRGGVTLALDAGGLRVDRGEGAGRAWCVPTGALRGAEVAAHHAGKTVGAGRVLVVDWALGATGLRSGFALEPDAASAWAERLRAVVAA